MVADTSLQGAILTVAVSLGVLGNIPIIVSICQKRSLLKSNHYYLILHLAICDFFYLIFFIPDIISIFRASPSIASSSYILCKTLWPVHTTVFTAGANFLIISILRYRATVYPFKPAVSRRTLKISSTAVYVFAISCSIPHMLVLRFDEISGCSMKWPMQSLNITYTLFLSGIQYFIPVAFLSIIHYKIGKVISTRNKRNQSMDARNKIRHQNTPTSHERLKSVKTLFVCFTIVLCFTVFGFPAQILWIIFVSASKEIPSYYLL